MYHPHHFTTTLTNTHAPITLPPPAPSYCINIYIHMHIQESELFGRKIYLKPDDDKSAPYSAGDSNSGMCLCV